MRTLIICGVAVVCSSRLWEVVLPSASVFCAVFRPPSFWAAFTSGAACSPCSWLLPVFSVVRFFSLLWAPPLPPVAPVEQALLLRTLPPGAARLIDCIAFLLLKLLEQNSQVSAHA